MSLVNELVCPYCNSKECIKDYDLTWKDDRFSMYSVVSCASCKVGFSHPLPTPDELKTLYDSVEYHDEDRGAGDLWNIDQEQIDKKISRENLFVRRYEEHLPTSGHVLDVGAGWGTLLKSFANRNYKTTGIELSTTASEFANQRLDLNVFNLPIERLNELPDESYDIVTMRHVMEHFYEPKSVLLELRNRLSDDGRLIIEVPDYGSYDRKAYGTAWPAFAPYHLWYFSQASLDRLLADTGFRVIQYFTYLSDRIFPGRSIPSRLARRITNQIGGKRWLSGRSIHLIASKSN